MFLNISQYSHKKYLRWSLFLIMSQAFLAILLKRCSNAGVSCKYCKIFKNGLFYRTPLFVSLLKQLYMGTCESSLLNQKYNVGWFLLKKFADLEKVCYLHVISRNHSSTLLLINLRKTNTCPK